MADIFGDSLFLEFERPREVHTSFTDTVIDSFIKEDNVSVEYSSAIFNQSDGDQDHLEVEWKSDNDSNQYKIVWQKDSKSSSAKKKMKHSKISNLIKNDSILFNAKHSTLSYQHCIAGEDVANHRIRPAKNKLVLRIVYSNHKICRKLRGKLEKFLKETFSEENVDEEDSKPTKVDGVVDFFSTYCRDSKGQPVYIEPGTTEGWVIPVYDQVYKIALPYTDEDEIEPLNVIGAKKDKAVATCFNCGENHMLHECRIPLDKHRINQNRKEFLNKFGTKQQSRYHIEDDPRFSKFKPGVISDELRNALNLNENELPLYIYRMRLYGYPPGYQKSAEVEGSGITVYDSDGKAMGDQLMEDGEVTEPGEQKTTYDISKLIDYPGFNVDPPPGTNDNHVQYGLPSMLSSHQKSAQESYMKARAADHLKRRRSKVEPKKQPVTLDREELDMDVDALESGKEHNESSLFTPPLPAQPPLPKETPPHTPLKYDSDTSCTSTPTTGILSDLEDERVKIMNQLQQGVETESPANSSLSSSISEMISTPYGSMLKTRFLSRSVSKALNLGTPVVTSHTPYVKLPDADKFSDGITPHMDFENLPNATGKFDKLRGVLSVVRSKLQNATNQDS